MKLPAHWQVDVPLAPLSTFGLGGRAAFYVAVTNSAELQQAVVSARESKLEYCLVAGGSNLVFPDGPWPGLIIHFSAKPGLTAVATGGTLEAPAGLALASLVATSLDHSLAGLEALSGIPGSVGGALVGNAGAYGQSISDHLVEVEVFDIKTGQVRSVAKRECEFAYRDSLFKHDRELVVLSGRWELTPGDGTALAQKSREIIQTREAKYAPGLKCPGSFFKNVLVADITPEALAKVPAEKIRDGKIATGWLLEEAGARGMSGGDIAVADFHGNLLYNHGQGTAEQVKILANKLKQLVWDKFGVKLEEEVRYL